MLSASLKEKFESLVERGKVITGIKALLVSVFWVTWGVSDYSFWLLFLSIITSLYFIEASNLFEKGILSSAIVNLLAILLLIWNFSPDAYGLSSLLFISLLLWLLFFLIFGLSSLEFVDSGKALDLYYVTTSFLLFLSVFVAVPYHPIFSFVGAGIGSLILVKESLSHISDLESSRIGLLLAVAVALVSVEVFIVIRMLPVSFLHGALLVAAVMFVARSSLVLSYKKSLTREVVLEHVMILVCILLLIGSLTKWSL